MKRVLLIMPYGSVGGMERLALYFYNYYKEQGYLVKGLKLIKLSDDIISFGEDELFFSEVDFSSMSRAKRLFFYLRCPLKINKVVKKYKITHSISFGDMANLFSSLSFSKEFKTGSIHALKSSEFSCNSFFNKIFKLSYKTSYYFLDKVVCISKAIREDLILNCGYKFIGNLEVIYNPHNIDQIRNLAREKITDSEEALLFESPVILFLGRISNQKAPWHLLKAFKLLIDKHPNAKLVFLGDGSEVILNYLNSLIEKYSLKDYVVFLGRKSNPYKYLEKSKLLALSSYYEGTPNVIIEAMALNIPIATTNCTDGIGELMGLKNNEKSKLENIKTEVGFITPSVFKGDLNIPSEVNFTGEEKLLAEAMHVMLEGELFFKNREFNEKLLKKFRLDVIANKYLEKINK